MPKQHSEYDEEDQALQRDEAFWRMIHERRKEKTIPLAEVKKELGIAERKNRKKLGARRIESRDKLFEEPKDE